MSHGSSGVSGRWWHLLHGVQVVQRYQVELAARVRFKDEGRSSVGEHGDRCDNVRLGLQVQLERVVSAIHWILENRVGTVVCRNRLVITVDTLMHGEANGSSIVLGIGIHAERWSRNHEEDATRLLDHEFNVRIGGKAHLCGHTSGVVTVPFTLNLGSLVLGIREIELLSAIQLDTGVVLQAHDTVVEQSTAGDLVEIGTEVFELHPEDTIVLRFLAQFLAVGRSPLSRVVTPVALPFELTLFARS